jgi:6-pyruvoyltetrahydropterin/6-carboxytetrahydropterin synthase
MPRAHLTRRVTFAAAHRYRRPEWSDEQNEKTFGLCARESYHGHSYVCEVTVGGEIDPLTGFIMDLGELDRILADEVKNRFDHRNINVDVPEFADGRLVPSGENLARFIFERVGQLLPKDVSIESVNIAEDRTLSATYRGGANKKIQLS